MIKKNHIIDLLLHSAKGFYDIAFNCAFNIEKDHDITGFQRIAPGAVNMSFAAELFLKAIHLITNNHEIRGHKLFLLFKGLKQEVQNDIHANFEHFRIKDKEKDLFSSYQIVVSNTNNKKEEPVAVGNLSLFEFLERHNLAFENWRYLHEIESDGYTYHIDFKLMHCFIKSMIVYINENKSKYDLILKKAKTTTNNNVGFIGRVSP